MKNLASITIIFLFLTMHLKAQQVTTEWVINNFPGYPVGVMVVLDQNNNVLVTGQSGDHTKIITTKYDTDGNLIWERFYTIPGFAVVATWLSKDNSGNVIVTGYRHNFSSNPVESGLLTLKYDNDGNLLWDKLIPGTWAFAVRSIVDQSGNIYVTGRAWQYTATHDFVTVKYSQDGTQLWFDTFDQNGGFHTPTSIDLDQTGNLFITGLGLSGGLITVMYNNVGARQWVREHSGSAGTSIKVDVNGGIFVTGSFYNVNTGNDLMLLKYNLSGNLVLEKFYDFGNSEYGKLVNIDSHSNIFITGFGALPQQFPGWITAKINPSGDILWYRRFKSNQAWEEFPYFALIGPRDEIYITGNVGVFSGGTTYHGLETVRYNSDGSNPWIADVNQYAGIGTGLALGADLDLYAVGKFYYSIIKYSQLVNPVLTLSVNFEMYNAEDSITVELRNATSPFALVESKTGLGGQGTPHQIQFTNAVTGTPYYIVVKQRNSIETWSKFGGEVFNNGTLTYNFTTAASQAFGNNMIFVNGKYSFYAGDVNQDGIVDAADLSMVDNDALNLLSGYVVTDLNGDNIVDASDLSIADNNVFNSVMRIIP